MQRYTDMKKLRTFLERNKKRQAWVKDDAPSLHETYYGRI